MAQIQDRISLFPDTTKIDAKGQLEIGGSKLPALVEQFGTPVYIYDGATIGSQIDILKKLLQKYYSGTAAIAYATKAYFSLAFARKLVNFGVGADLITIGDIRTAQKAKMDPSLLHLHGNNKSEEEIRAALAWDIAAIVVDSLDELALLESIAQQLNKTARIWLRITPDIAVDTHHHIQTSHAASKFGLHISDGQASEAIKRALKSQWLNLRGLHTHLGSQLRETQVYEQAIAKMYAVADECTFKPKEFSPGGGWGVRYLPTDEPNDPEKWINAITTSIQKECAKRGWELPHLVIEPGRYTVARAGVALYSIGAQKLTPEGEHIAAVDGGLADNPRVALYNARYTALVANRASEKNDVKTQVVGKFCETGDVLIDEVDLPRVTRGDILAIPVSGAYQLSMSSNYNFATRPAVLWLEDGKVEVMQKRERPEESKWWSGS